MGIVRPIVKTVGDLPQRVRDLARLREVAQVLVKHGFGLLVGGIELPGFPKADAASLESTPERVVAAIQELGPTYVKLGQVLSTRPDLLGPEYIEALQQLQDDVRPIPVAAVHAELARELGEGWRERIGAFDDAPLATASIGQVHTGRLLDGTEVVFKVRRPGAERVVRADLAILQFLARRLVAEFPEASSVDVDGVIGEFGRSILAEMDFREEARNQARIGRNFGDDPRVRVPRVVSELSSAAVLCMERLRGVKIREAREAGHDMTVVGERYLSVAYDMLFVHGFFHGDLHPGNVLVLPGDVIGLLDFGMMGRLTPQMRSDVVFIMFAIQRGDWRTIARLFYDIAIKTRRVDYRAIERDTVEFFEKHWAGNSIKDLQLGPYIVELARKAAGHGARVPPDYTMFFKALVTSEGLAKSLIPEVDPIEAATPYFERMVRERFEAGRLQGDALYHALTIGGVVQRLPISLAQFLDDLDAQRLSVEVREVADHEALDRADRRQNRLILGLAAVGFAWCGTAALDAPAAWWGTWPVLPAAFFALALASGAVALVMILGNRGR
ncbi:MAG TPA: AarF/UbiB family protein [Myxococcota bacterium]|nr:AarF/UbiB family protein [Myxococcota bacterium]